MLSAIALAFILYFSVLIGIGLWFYKKNQTADEFMVGDRSVNYWVTAIATQASDMGSWLFLGFPAMVFTRGFFELWTAIGLVIGMLATWILVAPKLRERTGKLDSLTLSSYFSHEFHDTRGTIQIASALFGLLFFTFYIASGLVGLSLVFGSAFGVSYHAGIVASLVTAAFYTLVGGFVAVAWCDFFQGLFLLAVILLVPIAGLLSMGTMQPIIQAAQDNNISLSLIGSWHDTLAAIFLAASWGLGYFGQPHILVNFMGIDDVKNIPAARNLGIAWQILVLLAAASIGLIGIGFFAGAVTNPEMVFVDMSLILFHPFITGLILCGIFAASLSTMDSLILVAGSSIALDIYKKFVNHRASNTQILWVSRAGSLAVSAVALMLAWQRSATVYGLVNYAWSGLGSTFGPLMIASLYSSHISAAAALCGLIAGGVTSALWPSFFTSLPLVPGFAAGLLAIYVGNLLMPRK